VSSLPRRQDNLQKVLSWYFQMKSPDSVAATRMRWLGAAADDPGAQRTGESPVLFSISALAPFFRPALRPQLPLLGRDSALAEA
jgi:hypothetical protein